MFKRKKDFIPFESKVWLASPTMHGEEMEYMQRAYETNWMSTVGENINEVERIAAERAGVKYALAVQRHFICALNWQAKGFTGSRLLDMELLKEEECFVQI